MRIKELWLTILTGIITALDRLAPLGKTGFHSASAPVRFLHSSTVITFAVAVTYVLVAKVSFLIPSLPGDVAPFYPPAGVALAAVLLLGRPAVFGVLLGAFTANIVSHLHADDSLLMTLSTAWPSAVISGIGSMLGAAVGAFLVQRFCKDGHPLESRWNVLILIVAGAFGSCLITPSFGVFGLAWCGLIPWQAFGTIWISWWGGDLVGTIVFAPFLLAWHYPHPFRKSPWRTVEAAGLGGLTLLLCFMVFFRQTPFEYALMLVLLWAAFRFGMRGVSTTAVFITCLATIGTSLGSSSFVRETVNESLLLLYSFLGVTNIWALFLGGILAERKRAVDSLRASESRLKLATSAGNIGVWDWNVAKNELVWDDSMYSLYGLSQEDFPGAYEAWSHTLHPDDRQYTEDEIQAALRGEREYAPEFRIVLPDGAVRNIKAASQTFRDQNGSPLRMIGINIDITARKQGEDKLRNSEETLRTVLEASPLPISSADPTGHIEFWNRQASELFGYAQGQIPTVEEWFARAYPDPHYRQEVSARWGAAIVEARAADGVLKPSEYKITCNDGTIRTVEIFGAVANERIVVIFNDITDRKRAEEKLRESQEKYRYIVENAPMGIYSRELWGKYNFVNPFLVRQFECATEEEFLEKYGLISQRWAHPEKHADFAALLSRDHQVSAYEVECRLSSGKTKWFSIYAFLDAYRSIVNGFSLEITDRKRSEAEKSRLEGQLSQAQKMEAIGTLAGGIAHDFNNILSPIVGYTELAKDLAASDPKLSGYLNQVSEAALRATALVRQILTFSRKSEQQKMPLQIALVVKEALKLLRSSIPTSIEIRQEITSQALVLADPTQIHQILMNLCTNAYQAMEKSGGILAVSLQETEITPGKILGGEIAPGRYVVLAVSDSGCGMDKETQVKIFEPYFTTKAAGKGTGLGLAVVHGIVKDHQGAINVYSEPGRGTTFRVYLPMVAGQMQAAPAKPQEAVATARHERILFVDDEEPICLMAKEYLGGYGYLVDIANNGRDALFTVEQDLQAYDLLITDMTMPGMNGKELTEKVLAMRPDLPVILCTGYSSLIDREEAARIGVKEYVEKPLLMNNLLSRIKAVLSRSEL
ncbi:MAG: PAS domain-containing protein [Desulfobulbaceae bacterium]|nr:PAS domain-containing protein [Desulfobulbaceae bacterium]